MGVVAWYVLLLGLLPRSSITYRAVRFRPATSLGQATSADGRTREWAGTDHDLDSVRDDPRFARAVE